MVAEATIAIISDTHMPKGRRRLPERCVELLAESELILHAGDWSHPGVVREIEGIGPPVKGIHGNVDSPEIRRELPKRLETEWRGLRIGMVHDAGRKQGRLDRLRREFSGCAIVVFGHSHQPLHETAEDGFQIFNPGSPTDRRRAPKHTMGLLHAEEDGRAVAELVEL
ncbi:MAG: metallophosphoesterase family protein [Solirubrobacterales bacterium]